MWTLSSRVETDIYSSSNQISGNKAQLFSRQHILIGLLKESWIDCGSRLRNCGARCVRLTRVDMHYLVVYDCEAVLGSN